MHIRRISVAKYQYPYPFKQGNYYPYPIRRVTARATVSVSNSLLRLIR